MAGSGPAGPLVGRRRDRAHHLPEGRGERRGAGFPRGRSAVTSPTLPRRPAAPAPPARPAPGRAAGQNCAVGRHPGSAASPMEAAFREARLHLKRLVATVTLALVLFAIERWASATAWRPWLSLALL